MRGSWATAALALAVVCLPLAAQESVRTNRKNARQLPLPKEDGVFHFLVFGDRTGGPDKGIEVLKQGVKDANLLDPDLVMTVGDLIRGYTTTRRWLAQAKQYKSVMGKLRMRWYPVAGNHDIYWRGKGLPRGHHEKNYETHFGPLWYWFKHKNAAFVVLYTDEGNRLTNRKGWSSSSVNRMSPAQLRWLKETLEKTKHLPHVLVFMHHPRWVESIYRGSNWREVHELLASAGNVSAVFAGHVHRMRYDGKKDGIRYYTLATTGGGLSMNLPGGGWLHHMNLVTVRRGRVEVSTIPVGAVIDPRVFTPERLAEIDTVRRARPAIVSTTLALTDSGRVDGSYRCTLANTSTRPIELRAHVEARSEQWVFRPEHVHGTIAPGKSMKVEFRGTREAGGLGGFAWPELSMQLDYLAEDRRISFPARSFPLRLSTAKLTDRFYRGRQRALSLSGRSDCARVYGAPLPDGPFTIEAWLKGRRFAGRRALLAKTQSSEYSLFVSGGQPSFSVHLAGKYVTVFGKKGDLKAGRWHHLAGVFDGAEVRLYLDGRLLGKRAGKGKRKRNRLPLYVGADPDWRGRPSSSFDGQIDEVRLSRGARYTGAEFGPARYHEPDARTELLLHCNNLLGRYLVDGSRRGRHPLLVGSAKLVASAVRPLYE